MNTFSRLLEDFRSQQEGLLSLGFWALIIYRFGHWVQNLRPRWLFLPLKVLHRLAAKLMEIVAGIQIRAPATIGRRFTIEHSGCIFIHSGVVIGDDCRIRQGVSIGNADASEPNAAPVIGNCVDVGAGVKIIGAIRIGNNVKIGANAVVISDIPDDVTCVGVPAKIVRRHGSTEA